MGPNSHNDDNRPQRLDEKTQTREDQLDVTKQAGAEWDLEHSKAESNSSGKPRRKGTHMTLRTDVQIVKYLMQEVINKLDDRVIGVAEQNIVDALEIRVVDYNKALSKPHSGVL